MNPFEIISAFLESAREKNIQEYYLWAFEESRKYIDFDSGYFFAFSKIDGVKPAEFSQFNLDDININNYLPFIESDPSFHKALPLLGKPIIDSQLVSLDELDKTPAYHEFYKPFKIEEALFTIKLDRSINLFKDFSLYRDSRDKAFNENESKIKEVLDFAFFEGRKIALTKLINGSADYCICNSSGIIVCASNGDLNRTFQNGISSDLINKLELSKAFNLPSCLIFIDGQLIELKYINCDYILVTYTGLPKTILTARQVEIAYLYSMERMSRNDLSDYLDISIGTVKNHLNDIKERYGLQMAIGKRGNIDIRRRVGERLKDEWNRERQ